jgi:decaprenyl-phosphate phosphoribosyltransferase
LNSFLAMIRLMRPKQWVKNAFVFAPLVFSHGSIGWHNAWLVFYVFVLFCVGSAATYVLNDICDVKQDRRHPRKKITRPLAANQLSLSTAKIVLFVLYALLFLSLFIEQKAAIVVFSYLVLNICYSYYLKHQPVLDLFSIAVGFVLRVYAGSVILTVPLSGWMFVTTLSLAIFLAASKRATELNISPVFETRKVLQSYTPEMMRAFCIISATASLMFYCFFALTQSPALLYTIPLVMFGIFRYWFLVETLHKSESPTEALLTDWGLMLVVLLWVMMSIYIIHVGPL